jgi:Tfp pilus assembly protein PilO
MSAGKNIMVIPAILLLLLFIYLALTLKNNSTKVIGAVVIEPGFNNLAPQINGRHYHANGQYTVNVRSFSQTPITLTEIKLQDKATGKQCNTTLITRADALNYKETASVSAKCPKRTVDDVYILSAEINYRFTDAAELHQETGDISGDIEQ